MLPSALAALLAAAVPAIDLEDMLRRPRSPATLASLVQSPADPRVLREWEAALADERAEVRATAARAIHSAGVPPLVARVDEALARETSELAAVELIRALAGLGDAKQLETLPERARRFGAATQDVTALALARRLGMQALLSMPTLWQLDLGDERALLSLVSAGQSERLATLASLGAVRQRPALLAAALAAGRAAGVAVPWPAVEAVVLDSRPEARSVAYWHLTFTPPSQLPETIRKAARDTPEGRGQGQDPEAAFVFELLSRHLGGAKTDATAELKELYRERRPRPPLDSREAGAHLTDLVTPGEAQVLAWALVPKDWTPSEALEFLKGKGELPFPRLKGQPGPARTLDPTGLVIARDAARIFGCAAGDSLAFGALMIFGPDARPVKTSLLGMDDPNLPCARAAILALATALAPADHDDFTSSRALLVFLPMDGEFLGCAIAESLGAPASPASRPTRAAHLGGRLREPQKVNDVKPYYPEEAKRRRVQGVVLVEALISTEGCVASLKLLTSPDPSLSWAALWAVARWRYTPTILDGTRVPVVMTVTVNFRLH